MNTQVGTVSGLWRYPVKSLRGEQLSAMNLTESGPAGDRLYALRELKYGAIMSARMFPAMLRMCAVCEAEPAGEEAPAVRIELPDGSKIRAADRASNDILSDLFEHPVRLERPRGDQPLTLTEIEAVREGRAFLPPRDFYDEDVVHLLASGTLEHLRRLSPSDFDPRRFRPNIYIDSGPNCAGFVEDGWLGGELEIGARGARIAGIRPALRCAMTIHPQEELRADPAILRTAARHHGAHVGIFGAVLSSGVICTGDPVWLEMQSP
jgi:uncharacterized protein